MSIRRRVDNVQEVIEENWRGAWKDLGVQVAYMFTHNEAAALCRLLNIYLKMGDRRDSWKEEWERLCDAAENLSDEERPPEWEEWQEWQRTFWEAIGTPLQRMPNDLPSPPEEPAGVWEEARAHFPKTSGYERLAVMDTLWWLAVGRATRGLYSMRG